MVVQGIESAEVTPTGATELPLAAGIETVGTSVMVEGTAVTIPGFWGTQAAQIPVKQDMAAWISELEEPHASMQLMTLSVKSLLGQ